MTHPDRAEKSKRPTQEILINHIMQRRSELPHVQIKIGDTKLTALIDSGSAATLLSSSAWDQISDKPALRSGAAIQLRSVTGDLLPNQGETDLPVTIGNQTTTVRAQVISGLPFRCILGIDFIRCANLILRAAENCVQVGQNLVPITSRCEKYDGPRAVTTVHAITIEPQQGVIMTVQSDPSKKDRQMFEFSPLAEESANYPFLQVDEISCEIGETGLFQVRIANPSDQQVELPAGSVIGSTIPFEGIVATINLGHQTESSETSEGHLGRGLTLHETERANNGMNPERKRGTLSEPVMKSEAQTDKNPFNQAKAIDEPDGRIEAKKGSDTKTEGVWRERWTSREAFLQLFDMHHLEPELRNKVENLLCKYESIFASHDFDLGQIQIATHTIKIQPNSAPVYCRPFRCSEFERKELHRQLQQMLEHGLIEPAYDGYRSPVLLVKKAGATAASDQYRLVQSFVKLNAVTEPIRYPLPNMQQVLEDLGRHRGYFSSMDMTKSFWQLRIRPECAKYASFTTELGDFTPRVVLMGLKGASETLQRVIDQIYGPVLATGKVRCYLDDLVCATPDEPEHLRMLEEVFRLAQQHGVKYKPSKTKLFRKSIKLLGHVVSSEGIRVDDTKISAINNIAPPSNKTETRAYLGLTAFYRRFIPSYARIAQPLINLLKKNVPFLFDDQCMQAFRSLKAVLTSAPVLRYPDFSGKYPFQVYTDASDKAIGAVLHQTFPDGSHPIAYASRVLQPSEICLPIYARESLAAVFAITEKFRKYLQGRHFTLFCDNAAVSYLLKSVKDPKHSSARLTRDAIKLLDFDFTIQLVRGSKIPHVDGLTRVSWETLKQEAGLAADIDLDAPKEPVCAVTETSLLPYSIDEWRQRQKSDEVINKIIETLKHDHVTKGPIRYQKYQIDGDGLLVFLSHGRKTRVVPSDWHQLILRGYHDGPMGGHQGARAMMASIQHKYHWPSIRQDVNKHVLNCSQCEQRNAGFRGRAPLQENYQATRPFQKVSIDFMTGLPATDRGNSVLLTAICCFSRWVELVPLPNRSAKEVAMALTRSIFFRHGCCKIVSDSGKEFVGEVMTQVYNLLGIDARTNTYYHPASQGKIERTHRVIADILSKFVSAGQTDWDLFVPPCMMAINSAVHSATGYSPYYLIHGRHPTLPPDALLLNDPPPLWRTYSQFVEDLLRHTHQAFSEAREHIGQASGRNRERVNAKARMRQIEVGQRVLLYTPKVEEGEKRKLAKFWRPGFEVVQRFGNVNYLIEEISTKKMQLVHVDRIKVQLSKTPTTEHHHEKSALHKSRNHPSQSPNLRNGPTDGQALPASNDAESTGGFLNELDLAWEWEPVAKQQKEREEVPAAAKAKRSTRLACPTNDSNSSEASAPVSDRSAPATKTSFSLSSSDGLHLSTDVSPNYTSESDPEERGPAEPLDTTRRYPTRRRRPPDRWTPTR